MEHMTDDEIQEFARRMIEGGVTEATFRNPALFRGYLQDTIVGTKNLYRLSRSQVNVVEYGAGIIDDVWNKAGVAIRIVTPPGQVQVRYADATTGRLIKAQDAYSRIQAAGGTTPKKVYSKESPAGVWKYAHQKA